MKLLLMLAFFKDKIFLELGGRISTEKKL